MNRAYAKWGVLLAAVGLLSSCASPFREDRPIRVAVIGGMMRGGLWPELARSFESQSGFRTELVLSGNRDVVAEAMRAGQVDVVAMHAGETASNLVAAGYARHMRIWARNEFVIIGPRADPAGIRGLRDGAVALERIARRKSPLVDYRNSGPREVAEALRRKAGIEPEGNWLLKTASENSEEALAFARERQAYLVLGRLPALPDGLEILVERDPLMQREFVVMEANPRRFPETNVKAARALAAHLLKPQTQKALLEIATQSKPGVPLFYPVKRP